MTKKLILWVCGVIVVVVVVAIGVVVFFTTFVDHKYDGNKPSSPSTQSSEEPADQQPKSSQSNFKAQVTSYPPTTLPDKFPSDIPIEPNAVVTQNFSTVNADGNYQATREFISAKLDNFTYYQSALKASGWNITQAMVDQTFNQDLILATRGSDSLNIRIYIDQGKVKVSINDIIKQ